MIPLTKIVQFVENGGTLIVPPSAMRNIKSYWRNYPEAIQLYSQLTGQAIEVSETSYWAGATYIADHYLTFGGIDLKEKGVLHERDFVLWDDSVEVLHGSLPIIVDASSPQRLYIKQYGKGRVIGCAYDFLYHIRAEYTDVPINDYTWEFYHRLLDFAFGLEHHYVWDSGRVRVYRSEDRWYALVINDHTEARTLRLESPVFDFYLDDRKVTEITLNSGESRLYLLKPRGGDDKVSYYAGCESPVIEVTVLEATEIVDFNADKDTVLVGMGVQISGVLKDSQGNGIPNKTIHILVNDEEVTTVITGEDGSFLAEIVFNQSGVFQIKATYLGD